MTKASLRPSLHSSSSSLSTRSMKSSNQTHQWQRRFLFHPIVQHHRPLAPPRTKSPKAGACALSAAIKNIEDTMKSWGSRVTSAGSIGIHRCPSPRQTVGWRFPFSNCQIRAPALRNMLFVFFHFSFMWHRLQLRYVSLLYPVKCTGFI